MTKKVAIRKAWADMDGNVQEGYDSSRAYEPNQYGSSPNPNPNRNPFKGAQDDMQPCPVCNGTGMMRQRPQKGPNPYTTRVPQKDRHNWGGPFTHPYGHPPSDDQVDVRLPYNPQKEMSLYQKTPNIPDPYRKRGQY